MLVYPDPILKIRPFNHFIEISREVKIVVSVKVREHITASRANVLIYKIPHEWDIELPISIPYLFFLQRGK